MLITPPPPPSLIFTVVPPPVNVINRLNIGSVDPKLHGDVEGNRVVLSVVCQLTALMFEHSTKSRMCSPAKAVQQAPPVGFVLAGNVNFHLRGKTQKHVRVSMELADAD
jgi:hypothetical protein